MISQRKQILTSIKKRIVRENQSAQRTVEERLNNPCPNTVPGRAQLPPDQRLALFERMLEESSATFEHINDLNELPKQVADFLNRGKMPLQLCINDNDKLADLPWSSIFDEARGPQTSDLPVSVVSAFRGIAETGTLVLLSGAGKSTAAHFLPETLVVVLATDHVLGTEEDLWIDLRLEPIPRTVNLVTGPSRTGDIEQKIVLGAHGPKFVHVVLVD